MRTAATAHAIFELDADMAVVAESIIVLGVEYYFRLFQLRSLNAVALLQLMLLLNLQEKKEKLQ